MNEFKWAAARLVFYVYIVFSLLTVVGGFLTAPIMTWYFFGDWRFWRHIVPSSKLFLHGWKMIGLMLRGDNGGFLLAVPLHSEPMTGVDRRVTNMSPTWSHGTSCGECTNCCSLINCPVLDKSKGLCMGYNSFFWRYFNCGRFPSTQPEIDYYACPKWLMNPRPSFEQPEPVGEPAYAADDHLETG